MTKDSLDLWDSQMRREIREEVRKALSDLGEASDLAAGEGPVVEMSDLYLSFGDFSVLEGISLDLHRGETLSVLGGSGAAPPSTHMFNTGWRFPMST